MGIGPARSVKTAPVATNHLDDESTLRRVGLPVACGWLVLVACVEFALSWFLLQFGEPIDVPALAAAGAGLGLGMLGYFVAGQLKAKGRADVPDSVRRTLGIGAFSLPVLSLGWNLGSNGFWVVPAACSVAVIGGLVCAVGVLSRGQRRDKRRFVVTVVLVTASIVLSCFAWAVPDGLSLKFAANYEAGLTRRLAPGTPSFDVPGHPGYVFWYGPEAPVDLCARHLIGPWWEAANEAPFCPTGFIVVEGP